MYNPPTFLTKEVLLEILSEFEWSESFVITDDDCTIDGINVRFSKCALYFREGFESDMSVYISNPHSGNYWSSFYLIYYIFAPKIEKTDSFKPPIIHNYFSPHASLLKVQYELRDLCILIQTYLFSCLEGDFDEVEEFYKKYPNGNSPQ